MSEQSAALQLVEILQTLLEESFPEVLEEVEKDIGLTYKTPEDLEEEFLIPEIPGYLTEMSIKFENLIEYGGAFQLELFCSLSWRQTTVRREVDIAPALWQAVTQEENEATIIPAIKSWWQEKLQSIPYGGAFDYRVATRVLSYISAPGDGVCQLEEYITDPDPKRQAVWREKLADCIRSGKYREHDGEMEQEVRLAEPLLMVDELGLDAVAAFFRYLKGEAGMNFTLYYGLPGFDDNVGRLCRAYEQTPSPTGKQTQDFHDTIMLALEIMEEGVPTCLPRAIRALMKNDYPFAVPYALHVDEAMELLRKRIAAWAEGQEGGAGRLRELEVMMKQDPTGPLQITVDDEEYEDDRNIFLLACEPWPQEALDGLQSWFAGLMRERQDLFLPRVFLDFDVRIIRWQSYELDVKIEPEYGEWAGERLRLLEQGRFDEVGYPFEAKAVEDVIELLEQTDAAFDYLEAFEAHAGAENLDMDDGSLLYALSRYFEREETQELGDLRKQNAQSALARFLLRHGESYRLERPRKHLKRLHRAGNGSAREFLKDYQEWLDADYWFGTYDPNGVEEKLRAAAPKDGFLYKQRTRGTDVVVALVEDSKEAYAQALDYLLKAVPKAAKRAEQEETEHSVTIFFPDKPSFPEVPIYEDSEFQWPELKGGFLGGMPRSPELAFFKRALEWEELHGKVLKYADALLKGEYRINGDAEFCSLAALPVVTALVMHDRKYFPYAGKYAVCADDEHEEVQIHLIPGIIRRYGLDEESAQAIFALAGSFQNGYEYVELFPELMPYLDNDWEA